MDSAKPLQEYYPPLKARGMVELVGAKQACCQLFYLIAAPAATSLAVLFTDVNGVQVEFADASYVVQVMAEGTIVEPDESTKTVLGLTLLSKDYAGSATNFLNSINLVVVGRLKDQPITQP